MAIDRSAILTAIYQGAGIAAKTLLPPTVWGYDAAIPEFRYDPAAAKKMLADAGYKDGFSTDLWAMPVQRPYDPDGAKLAAMVQADLAKIGVKATIASDAWDDYRRRAQSGEPQMAELGWIGDNGDPDNFLTPLAGCDAAQPGGSNIARWCDKDSRRADRQGGGGPRSDGASATIRAGTSDHAQAGAVPADRAFRGVHADGAHGDWLQDGPARDARFRGGDCALGLTPTVVAGPEPGHDGTGRSALLRRGLHPQRDRPGQQSVIPGPTTAVKAGHTMRPCATKPK